MFFNYKHLAVLGSLLATTQLALADEPKWVDASGKSCNEACKSTSLFPVEGGNYVPENSKFYVCAANTEGEGFRPGYNWATSANSACVVGYGGKEIYEAAFKCLCNSKSVSIP
jgi:hypothetical protein